mmetsp:Transcript_38311/g.81797  ORF Transcript_38311/g.81797 Transcript_38311/m.81797 type:complete len:275 (+) Transcript_38311:394-1218(+)
MPARRWNRRRDEASEARRQGKLRGGVVGLARAAPRRGKLFRGVAGGRRGRRDSERFRWQRRGAGAGRATARESRLRRRGAGSGGATTTGILWRRCEARATSRGKFPHGAMGLAWAAPWRGKNLWQNRWAGAGGATPMVFLWRRRGAGVAAGNKFGLMPRRIKTPQQSNRTRPQRRRDLENLITPTKRHQQRRQGKTARQRPMIGASARRGAGATEGGNYFKGSESARTLSCRPDDGTDNVTKRRGSGAGGAMQWRGFVLVSGVARPARAAQRWG